jgi:hypothetical protein
MLAIRRNLSHKNLMFSLSIATNSWIVEEDVQYLVNERVINEEIVRHSVVGITQGLQPCIRKRINPDLAVVPGMIGCQRCSELGAN